MCVVMGIKIWLGITMASLIMGTPLQASPLISDVLYVDDMWQNLTRMMNYLLLQRYATKRSKVIEKSCKFLWYYSSQISDKVPWDAEHGRRCFNIAVQQ